MPESLGDSIATAMKTEQLCYFHENDGAIDKLESKIPSGFLTCL